MEHIYKLFIKNKYDDLINLLYNNEIISNDNLEIIKNKMTLKQLGKKSLTDKKYEKEFLKRIISFITRKKSTETITIKKKYYIIVANTELLNKLFVLYTYAFLSSKQQFVGIDLEFNTGKIALMQLCFFPSKKKFNYIWISSPPSIDISMRHQIINNVFINQKIFKIAHGPDALDTPYLLHTYLENNDLWIMNFVQKSIETRFFCEFIKLLKEEEDKKCSIYDALLYFKTIDNEKYDELTIINKQMVPLKEHENWDITEMSKSKTFYAAYDVVYLKPLIFDMIHNIDDGETYYRLNMSIYRMITMDKYDVISVVKDSKKMVDPINNYLVPDKKTTLIKIFNEYVTQIKITNPKLDVNILLNINYYRTSLMILIKRIIYHLIISNYSIYVNKFYQFKGKITITDMFEIFKTYKLEILNSFFQQVLNELKKIMNIK